MTDLEAARRLLRRSRREAVVILIVWALSLFWTVGYCYLNGYRHEADGWPVRWGLAAAGPQEFRQLLGVPHWVAVGIVLPWLACTVFTVGFSLFGMSDDDLGIDVDEGGRHGH